MIQEGHKNDGRYAELNRKMEQMMELVRGGRADARTTSPAAGSAAPRKATSQWRGVGDPRILRANTHQVAERGKVMQVVQSFAAEHTTVPPEAICIAGPATSRNFVVKFLGDVATATRRFDELVEALKDQAGQWRALNAQTPDGSMTRWYMGRDKPREQLQVEVCGKRIVSLLAQKHPKAEVYQTRRDGVVHVDRQQVVKLQPSPEGPPQIQWNLAAMEAVGVTKQEIVNAMDRGGASGGAQPGWES